MSKKPLWIAGIARGHNAGVCLMKDGEIIFSIEEERLTRQKYDGGPLASMLKIKEYTDKLDYLVIAHTTGLEGTAGKLDYTGEDVYTGLARKLGLINSRMQSDGRSQVVDVAMLHHKMHAAMAFYRSGFENATAVIVDGAGTFLPTATPEEQMTVWETESIFECNYPANIKTIHKTLGARSIIQNMFMKDFDAADWEQDAVYDVLIHDRAGIVKAYEAVTEYCGWSSIEAGKTMGLFPYGKPNDKFAKLFEDNDFPLPTTNRNMIIPRYPNGAIVNYCSYNFLNDHNNDDVTLLENRRDLAYAVQTETQQAVADLIRYAVNKTGNKNVVISGGYGLNCVANYFYLKELEDEGINLYVEPVSNDAGTAMGAALFWYHSITNDSNIRTRQNDVYLGPEYIFDNSEINETAEKYNAQIQDATHQDIVELITGRNIVTLFQGRSENGPRALGNRSILYDPTDPNGKDHVNNVKHREYFRPFAGSILEEDAHEWFDLRGMESSPTMMYAVNCHPGVEEKIPAIIHVDGTCRYKLLVENKIHIIMILLKHSKTRQDVL